MTTLSMSCAFLMTILFLLLRSPILVAMQVPADTLQSVGNSVTPLFFLLASSILNVILDILFMGPFHFGIRGAAAATILSQAVSALLAFIMILKRYPQLHFSAKDRQTEKGFVYGADECHLQHWKCCVAGQYQCPWKSVYYSPGGRQRRLSG